MKQALLIIDIQNDYFEDGKMALNRPEEALKQINRLEDRFTAEKQPIIYIQHIKHMKNADFFEVGTPGAELHPGLSVDSDAIVIEKHFPNSFLETNLEATLKELDVEQLVITGMMTHMCVDSTTRQAKELGYQPILVTDATATKALAYQGKVTKAEEVQNAFVSALQNFADLKTTDEYLA
ncbi:cysteine hydrolase family protein [Lactococcus termiticola]|uniref:Isochorismatase n=1 Tax=Lactococcus termiticola TaxID=2169526 RepID=A0A2R5HEP1_9LACT|nr:cysteine hydrolase family protein [Lactococcus termiticola]GBG96519.1 isochorismatase [Lactococcus termiticola]